LPFIVNFNYNSHPLLHQTNQPLLILF